MAYVHFKYYLTAMQIPIHFYLGRKKSFHSSLGWTDWAELFSIASVGFLAHRFGFTFVFVFCWVSSSSWNLENFTLLTLPQSHPGPAIPVLWSFHHSPPVNATSHTYRLLRKTPRNKRKPAWVKRKWGFTASKVGFAQKTHFCKCHKDHELEWPWSWEESLQRALYKPCL